MRTVFGFEAIDTLFHRIEAGAGIIVSTHYPDNAAGPHGAICPTPPSPSVR